MDDLNVVDGFNQRQVYEEFKKYCKLSSEEINEYGVRTLCVTNGNPEPHFDMIVEFMPKESQMTTSDKILVHGFTGAGYSLETLLKIGSEMLGAGAFNTPEQVAELNSRIEMMSKISTSSHSR